MIICVNRIKLHEKENKSISWIKVYYMQQRINVKNISDMTAKRIKDIYNSENTAEN